MRSFGTQKRRWCLRLTKENKMKTCIECKYTKPHSDYHKSKRSPDGYNIRCILCKTTRERKRYQKNKRFIHRYKLWAGCSVCGYSRNPYALEFAHVDSKDKWCRGEAWSHSAGKGVKFEWSRKKIKNEIKKCTVLCANCHREQTYDYTSS
jgi:hypothetical protein